MNWTNQFGDSLPTRRWLGVAQRLLADIESGVYVPGDSLPSDRALAPEFQVSRGTIREALLALELIGALEMRHGSGTYVRRRWGQLRPELLTGQWQVQPEDLIEARRTVEPVVAAQACLRASAEAIAELRADVEQASRLVSRSETLPRFVGLGLRFHADLAALSNNSLLASLVNQLVDLGSQPMWVLLNQHAMRSEPARQEQVDEHFEIVEGLEQRDIERVNHAITSHIHALGSTIISPTSSADQETHPGQQPGGEAKLDD